MARQFRAVRRSRRWTSIPGTNVTLTTVGTTGGGALAFIAGPETVVRMMGRGLLQLMDAPTAGDSMHLTVAIAVVTTDAATAGAGSLPDPSDEPEFPWLYWTELDIFASDTNADNGGNIGGAIRYEFDVRSQRIIRPGHSLVYFAQYVDQGGLPPVRWQASQVRTLVLES